MPSSCAIGWQAERHRPATPIRHKINSLEHVRQGGTSGPSDRFWDGCVAKPVRQPCSCAPNADLSSLLPIYFSARGPEFREPSGPALLDYTAFVSTVARPSLT